MTLSGPGRVAAEAVHTDVITFVLIEITSAALSSPVRISTAALERLTDDPRTYGARSTWRGADPATEPFIFVGLSYQWPGNFEGQPGETRLIVDAGVPGLIDAFRTIHEPPTMHMAKFTTADVNTPEPGHILADQQIRLANSDGETLQITAGWYPSWAEGPVDFADPVTAPALFFT